MGEIVICISCGQNNTDGKFCKHCGHRINLKYEPTSSESTQSNPSSKSSIAWFVVFLLMVLVATGAFLFVSSEKQKQSEEIQTTSVEETSQPEPEPVAPTKPTTLTFDSSRVVGGCHFRNDSDPGHSLYCEASVLVLNETENSLPLGDFGGFEMFPAEYASGSIACDGFICPEMLEPLSSLTVTVRNGHIYQSNAQISGFWLADSNTSTTTLFVPWEFSVIY